MDLTDYLVELTKLHADILAAVLVDGRQVQVALALSETMKLIFHIGQLHGITRAELDELLYA